MKKQVKWTVEEYTVLYEFCEEKGPAFCLQVLHAKGFFHRTESAVTNACLLLNLKYNGPKLGCYKKGDIPANKGKTLTPEIKAKSSATWFKKGTRMGAANNNYVPIGHESIRADGYTWVKVSEGKWEQKHRILYLKEFGSIPDGHLVVFRDGNPHNFLLENLEAITKKELCWRNRWGSGPSQFSLISGRAASVRLNKMGFGDRAIKANPQLLELAKAETLLKLQSRNRHTNRT